MIPNNKYQVNGNFKDKLKNLDTIVCLEESFSKMQKWSREKGIFTTETGEITLNVDFIPPFNEGKLYFGVKDWIYYFKIFGDEIKVYNIKQDTIKTITTLKYKNLEYIDFESSIKNLKEDDLKELKEIARASAGQVVMTFIYINEYRENLERIEKKEVTVNLPNSTKKKNNSKNVVTIGKYYIHNFEVTTNENKRAFERHVESWGVRGHWRTYKKSGKRVWIPEHKKGKGEKEAKEYKLS